MNRAEKLIRDQQNKLKQGDPAYTVGLQLLDMMERDDRLATILEEDLQNSAMGLGSCADELKKHADEIHKKNRGSCVCITPDEAEKIIRKFYGLPDPEERGAAGAPEAAADFISLEDFF